MTETKKNCVKHIKKSPDILHVSETCKENRDSFTDLEQAAIAAFKKLVDTDKNNFFEIFKSGVQWYREQIMKGAKLSGWIARDEDGTLHVFEVEPRRIEDKGRWWDRDYQSTMFDKCEFPDLKWEDEPQEVKMIVVKED